MLEQAIATDVIDDSTNQLVGTGLTYVVDADEQTTSVQPPTTSEPWCVCSKNGISQSKRCDTSLSVSQASSASTPGFPFHLVHTYSFVLARLLLKSPGTIRRFQTKIESQAGRIQHHLRHEQDIALAAAYRPCPPQSACSSPFWRFYLFQDSAGSGSVRQHQPRCYTVGHSGRRC